MSVQFSVYIATSLDGFIARPNGSVDWLNAISEEAINDNPNEDYGYHAFIASVDYLIMGRKSLETVLSFDVPWPYDNQRVIVLSNTMTDVPEVVHGKVEHHKGNLDTLVARLSAENCQRVYVDGGRTIQSFMRAGLITDLTLTTIPILLGEGIPLFGSIPQDIRLKHCSTQSYPSGFVQSVYELNHEHI